MTSVLPDNDAQLAAWFAKLEQLEEPKRTQMLTWVRQEFARERSLRNHTNAAELAASLDPAWVMTEANRLIAESIEECIHTRRGRLMITVPPQEGKTSLGAIWGVIRALQWHPEWRCMLGCFSAVLAEESSVAARNLISKFGTDSVDPLTGIKGEDELGLALASDKASAAAWRLRGHRGGLVAVGLGGTISGRPADLLIIDDPIKGMEAADSKATKKHVIEGFQGDLTTRLSASASIILIQCMTGDTPVLRPDGSETPLADIRPGDRIATYEDGKLTSSTVTNWRNNGPDQVRLIRTRTGRTVRANARHPFLVVREGREEWVRLGHLRVGDRVIATSSTANVCTMPEGSAKTTIAANADQIPTAEDATSRAVIGRIRPAAYAHRTTDDNWMMSAASESIRRATGGSGLALPARSMAAASPSPAKACVLAAIARTDGRRGTEHHPIPAPSDATATCGTGTGSVLTSTTNVSPIRAGCAPAAENRHRTTTCPSTGRASCALTTTTTLERSVACCAMSATSCFGETTPRSICARDSTTWSVTLDEIVEIADAGIEDVYDITVDRTENFIANGLASHNTRWAVDDLAGWILKRDSELPEEQRRWKHVNIPALSEEGLLDSLGREPGEYLVSSRGRTPDDWDETRRDVGARVWASLYQGSPSPLEGGLIKKQWLNDSRLTLVPPNPLLTVVGVDPSDSGHGDDAGIVAAQLDDNGNRISMIADKSEPMTSDQWAKAAVKLAVQVGASKIVVESFAAAETYRRVVEEAITAAKPPHPIEIVTWPPKGSGRGGGDALVRSTALLQQLENGRTRLVGHFPDFEEKATAWQVGQHQPDSLSALTCAHDELVHAGGLDWDFAAPFETDNAPVDLENWMGRTLE